MKMFACLASAFLAGVLVAACRGADRRGESPPANATTSGAEWFVDATSQTGLEFIHVNGMSGQFYYPEIIAPGVALFDYDNDGDLDVFLVQGGPLDRHADASQPSPARNTDIDRAPERAAGGGRLYRNDLQTQSDGSSTVHFVDVTAASGITATEYGMGAAVGDYDNDGCVDLLVTALGRARLFRNRCDGTFEQTGSRVLDDSGWTVSAAFIDIDRDGWLDLFVGHYLNWDPSLNTPCLGPSGKRVYCAPKTYVPQQSHLYHNERHGTFTDVTAAAGMAVQFGPALGVSVADFNADGWPDLYVANDGQENQLWINQHDGTFTDHGLLAGCAWSEPGQTKAGMGVDAGDFDDDGDDDLVVTNLTGEGHDLYVNDGRARFEPQSAASGLRVASLPFTGFGTHWIDVDNDGRLDLLTVNGTVQRIDALVRAKDPLPLRQRKQLYLNRGNGRFENVTARAGDVFARLDVGRGAAFGDIDNDGDTDIVVGNNGGSAQVLLNTGASHHHWIGLRLVRAADGRSTREGGGNDRLLDIAGAHVAVMRNDSPTRYRRAHTDGSFASASDPRVLVGLDASTERPRVRVTWPDGRVEEWRDLAIDRYTTLVEGSAR